MSMKIKLKALVISALAVCFLLCGCRLGRSQNGSGAVKVISIGDETVSLAAFKAHFDSYLPYMQYYGQDPLEDKLSLESFQDWLVDSITDDLVTLHQAKKAGFKLSEEQEEALSKETEEQLREAYEAGMRYAETMMGSEPDKTVEECFESYVKTESAYYTGKAMSWNEYSDFLAEEARSARIVSAYHDFVCAEFAPTEDDIADWYDSAVINDRDNYNQSPEKYRSDKEQYEQFFGVRDGVLPITYAPSGYCRIMQIVVTPKGDLPEEYSLKLARMEEIKAEYSELSFEDAVNNSHAHEEQLAKLMKEYRQLKDATADEYSAFVSEANAKITAAYSELLSGKPFAEVMLRYTEDDRVTEGSVIAKKGELIALEYKSDPDWSEEVKSRFAKLGKGEYSGIFMDGGSFRIIYYQGDEPSGEIPLEALHDDIKAVCGSGVQNTHWQGLLDEWKKDPALKINLELIRTVGLDKLEK